MPPRGNRKLDSDDEDAGSDECSRLKQLAQDLQICSKQRKLCSQEAELPKYLSSADGKDILKKSSTRKGRYLFHIAAELRTVTGGRMGTLAQLDSRNPVLYIDFPLGRLKMIGTLLFPKAKYLLLKFGTKDILCEDIFDSMVLFAEMHWVGTKEDNPSEAPLDMPEELQTAIVRESASGEAAADADTAAPGRRRRSPSSQQPASQPASQRSSQPASQRRRGSSEPGSARKRRKPIVMDDDSSDDQDSGADAEAVPLSQRQHLGRSSKAVAQKKLLEFSEEEDDGDGRGSDRPAAMDAAGSDADADVRSVSSEPDGGAEPRARGSQVASGGHVAGKRPASSKAANKSSKRQARQPALARLASRKKVSSGSESSGDEEDEAEDTDDGDSIYTG